MSNLDRRVQNTPVTTRLLGARNSGNREDPRGEDVVSLIHSILLSFLLKLKKKKKKNLLPNYKTWSVKTTVSKLSAVSPTNAEHTGSQPFRQTIK